MSEMDKFLAALEVAARAADIEAITPEDARHVLHHYGHPDGWQPGSFAQRLIAAAAHADFENLHRVGAGFPGIAAAVRLIQTDPKGVDTLRRIAGALS